MLTSGCKPGISDSCCILYRLRLIVVHRGICELEKARECMIISPTAVPIYLRIFHALVQPDTYWMGNDPSSARLTGSKKCGKSLAYFKLR